MVKFHRTTGTIRTFYSFLILIKSNVPTNQNSPTNPKVNNHLEQQHCHAGRGGPIVLQGVTSVALVTFRR
ncbi:hypothetical protein Hanom_Chr09g00857051 [Helianthus anomalus]